MRLAFPEGEFLAARLELDRVPAGGAPHDTTEAAFERRVGDVHAALERVLRADPAVAGVTFASNLPHMEPSYRRLQAEPQGSAGTDSTPVQLVSVAEVDARFFEVLGTPIVAGRDFHAGDLAADARTAIVNEAFGARVLGGRNPIGRRVRYVNPPGGRSQRSIELGPWLEIVGVVRDVAAAAGDAPAARGAIYHAVAASTLHPLPVAVHVRGDPAAFAARLRAAAMAVDPSLRLLDVMPLVELRGQTVRWLRFLFQLTLLVVAVAVVLSLAGIYAVLSFTVARRTREIGVRVALGSSRRRVMLAVFRRPLAQVSAGVAAGGVLAGALAYGWMLEAERAASPRGAALLAAYAGLMFGVCLLACIVPTWRAMRVQPTEALRADV